MKHRSLFALALLVSSSFALSAALAGIGDVGSPVVPSNLPAPAKGKPPATSNNPATPPSTTGHTQQEAAPLLVIVFNKKHVFFDLQLKQAISDKEGKQAEANYEVTSLIPADGDGKTKIEHLNEDYSSNLNDVVNKMQDLGVPSSRIHSSTQTSNDVTTQEVHITVK